MLDGSGFYDPDGTIVAWQWLQLSGPTVLLLGDTSPMASFPVPDVSEPGTGLLFELRVTDNSGLTRRDRVSVEALWINLPPVAEAGLTAFVPATNLAVLDGSNSTDPDDGIVSYAWSQVYGPAMEIGLR
jgi:hypothetical protein